MFTKKDEKKDKRKVNVTGIYLLGLNNYKCGGRGQAKRA